MTASRLYSSPDDFRARLQQRMPMDVGFTFTEAQFEALRRAFGDRFDTRHTVDLRGRIYLPWSRYYFVVQAGRERRQDPLSRPLQRLVRTVTDTVLCAVALAALAAELMVLLQNGIG